MQDINLLHMNASLKKHKSFLFHAFNRIRGNLSGMPYSTSPYKAAHQEMELKMNSVLNINVGIKKTLESQESCISSTMR